MAANNRRFQDFSTLPMEVILDLFDYLGHADRQAAGATCRHWYAALCHPAMNKNVMADFSSIKLSDDHCLVQSFIASQRPVHAFVLRKIGMRDTRTCLRKISTLARWVKFEDTKLAPNELREMIQDWKHLESLTIIDNTDTLNIYTSGDDLEFEKVFANIKELSLQGVNASFYNIVASVRELRSFRLVDPYGHTALSFTQNLNFEAEDDEEEEEKEDYFRNTFDLNMLLPHLPHLRELDFTRISIESSDLVQLTEKSEGRLKLKKLCLRERTQLGTILGTFLQTQPNLVYLNLYATEIEDDCIKIISECLPLLQDLDISYNREISNCAAVTLRNLKYLKRLHLARCRSITDDGIEQGIAAEENTTLRELNLESLFLSSAAITAVAKNLKALRILDISRNVYIVNDKLVQIIIEYLPNLIELNLSWSKLITDTALTGYSREKLAMIEQGHEVDATEREGFSIERLRGLQKLDLTGCYGISDITLKCGLKLKELCELNLSLCSKITPNSINWLVQNAPAIENLNLSGCGQMNNEAIRNMKKNLKRLKYFYYDKTIKG